MARVCKSGLVVVFIWAAALPAQGQDPLPDSTDLVWSDDWNTPEPWDWVSAGVLGASTLAIFLATDSSDGWWLRRNKVDEGVLRGMQGRTDRGWRIAGILSDVTRALVLAPPLFVDTGLAARADPELALRLAGSSVLALAVTTFLMTGAKYTFRRERPNARRCEGSDEDDDYCNSPRRYRSFFSGHAALAFTAASLTCTYHTRLPLYGPRAADLTACGAALGLATLTGVLRIVAEKHHFSDVMVGALVGMLSGFILPAALYFGFRR